MIDEVNRSDAILSALLDGKILEEHYISNLNFSWPHMTCVSGFTSRGGRAILVSYKDSENEIQKFALRFSTCDAAETFVVALKVKKGEDKTFGTNGLQRLWKWSRSEQNPTGKATASVIPQHWQPNSGLLMTNNVPDNPEGAVPCIALSKNDSYVMSSCGGKVSLFNMMTFKVMTTFMPPPPASTFLAFQPQDNNIPTCTKCGHEIIIRQGLE